MPTMGNQTETRTFIDFERKTTMLVTSADCIQKPTKYKEQSKTQENTKTTKNIG
jgi:hypothetical protein